MKTLLGDRYAPTTSSVGYLGVDIADATAALAAWRRGLAAGQVELEELAVGFPECLRRLEPLVGGARPRELFVEAGDSWTAYFDCGVHGTDAVSTIGHLSQAIGCSGIATRVVSDRRSGGGAVQFELFGPDRTEFLNYVRTISVARDGGKWRFDVWGEPQAFEEQSAYRSRRIRDRLTAEMVERYCRVLGVEIFDPHAYGPRSILVRTAVTIPEGGLVLSLEQVQDWLGIVPDPADSPLA